MNELQVRQADEIAVTRRNIVIEIFRNRINNNINGFNKALGCRNRFIKVTNWNKSV